MKNRKIGKKYIKRSKLNSVWKFEIANQNGAY